MALQLILGHEPIPTRNIVACIYGEPGVAKTSLAWTAENPLLCDFDAGIERSVGRKAGVRMDNWQDFLNLIRGKSEYGDLIAENGYKTIVVDTAESMLRYMGAHAISMNPIYSMRDGALSLKGYGAIKKMFEDLLFDLRKRDLDLVIICHARVEENGDVLRHVPKVTGGSYDILLAISDLVGYMEVKGDSIVLDFRPTERHFGKNAPGFPALKLPHYKSKDWSTFLSGLLQQTKDRFTEIDAQHAKLAADRENLLQLLNEAGDLSILEALQARIDAVEQAATRELLQQDYNKKASAMLAAEASELENMHVLFSWYQSLSQHFQALLDGQLLLEMAEVLFPDMLKTLQEAEDFNALVEDLRMMPVAVQKALKPTLLQAAAEKEIKFDADKKVFVAAQRSGEVQIKQTAVAATAAQKKLAAQQALEEAEKLAGVKKRKRKTDTVH